GSPTLNQRSSEEVAKGTYSRKFTADEVDEGIQSDTFTQENNFYSYSVWVFSTSETSINIIATDGSGGNPDEENHTIYPNKWSWIRGGFQGSSGSSGYIAFRSTDSSGTYYIDNVRIQNNDEPAIFLDGKDYIKIDGFDFVEVGQGFILQDGADYNEITNCLFENLNSDFYYTLNRIWDSGGVAVSTYNWIHNCTFANSGTVYWDGSGCDDRGDVLRVGNDPPDASSYNLIEDNVWYGGGHSLLYVATQNNTIRNN
ncbi:unnamed protein product, partial [marine sediment metagenome]